MAIGRIAPYPFLSNSFQTNLTTNKLKGVRHPGFNSGSAKPESAEIVSNVTPRCTSLRYGMAAYRQFARSTPDGMTGGRWTPPRGCRSYGRCGIGNASCATPGGGGHRPRRGAGLSRRGGARSSTTGTSCTVAPLALARGAFSMRITTFSDENSLRETSSDFQRQGRSRLCKYCKQVCSSYHQRISPIARVPMT
jgi:hypothetical protein